MTLGITLSSNVSAYTPVANIPVGFRPKYQGWFESMDAAFDITAGGNVRFMTSQTAGSTFNLAAVYIV